MRSIVALLALLSLAAPSVSYRAIELQSPISVTLSLKASSVTLPDIHRASGKADQSLSCGIVPPGYGVTIPTDAIGPVAVSKSAPPSVDRHGPPLAPRPPPLS